MAWCKTNARQWFLWVNFFYSNVPEGLHVLFNFVVKHSPVFFFGCFALCFWVKRGQNIEACTMNATSWNRRKPFFKFSAHLLVRVDVVQVIKARVHSGWFFFNVEILNFSLVLFFPLFALLLSGECFATKLKGKCKPSGTFEDFTQFTQKSHLH